jgi:hypothetical protein
MPTFPTMPLIMPTVGGSSGSWGTLLASAFLVLDGHQHLGVGSGGAQIVSAAININADLTFASYSATNLRSATFAAGQAVSGVRKLYVGADAELYWNNSASGTAIQLTNGTALNVSAFIGGIGGDYTSVSAALNYDNSAARYTLRAGGGTTWARVAAGEVRIHEHASTSSIYVALAAPAGIASPYTVTFPAAVPGSTLLVQVSSAGVMTFSNTVVNAVTFSGLITASAGVTSTGLVTANAGVTCAADQHVTVSGTGKYKHGDQVLPMSPLRGIVRTNWAPDFTGVGSTSLGYMLATGAGSFALPFELPAGKTMKSLVVARYGDGAADLEITVMSMASDGSITLGTIGSASVSNPAAAWTDTTVDLVDTAVATGTVYWVEFSANAANIRIGPVRLTYDQQ